MPIYEYGCEKCGETFEYMQSVSDEPKTVCEACGGPLRKLISSTSFQLKGSGWYKDLYSSSKPKSAGAGEGAAKDSSSSPASSESSSTESKKSSDKSNSSKGD